MDDEMVESRMLLAESNSLWEHTDAQSVWRTFKEKDWDEIKSIRQVALGLQSIQYTQERGHYEVGYLKIEQILERDEDTPGPRKMNDTEIWWWDAGEATEAERLFKKIVGEGDTNRTQCLINDARGDELRVYSGRDGIDLFFRTTPMSVSRGAE